MKSSKTNWKQLVKVGVFNGWTCQTRVILLNKVHSVKIETVVRFYQTRSKGAKWLDVCWLDLSNKTFI